MPSRFPTSVARGYSAVRGRLYRAAPASGPRDSRKRSRFLPLPKDLGEQPQMIWEGRMDGVSVLRICGRQHDIEEVRILPVQRQQAHFFE